MGSWTGKHKTAFESTPPRFCVLQQDCLFTIYGSVQWLDECDKGWVFGGFVLPSYLSKALYYVILIRAQRMWTVLTAFARVDNVIVSGIIGGAIFASIAENGENCLFWSWLAWMKVIFTTFIKLISCFSYK